jgi:hypothetical protein
LLLHNKIKITKNKENRVQKGTCFLYIIKTTSSSQYCFQKVPPEGEKTEKGAISIVKIEEN